MLATFPVKIEVVGPILTRDSAAGRFGVDAPVARDFKGRLMLAGSHVLGKIRHAILQLIEVQKEARSGPIPRDAADWFGGLGDEEEGRNRRRRVFLSDFAATPKEAKRTEPTRTRIKINETRGVVEDGALQVIETPVAVGELITFAGELDLLGTEAEIDSMLRAARLGFAWTTQMGGLRTVGFGRISRVEIGDRLDPQPVAPIGQGHIIRMHLVFRDPICVVESRNSGNTYVTGEVVPGGAIKGALANLILAGSGEAARGDLTSSHNYPSLARNFSALRFGHFFPQQEKLVERPHRWPFSLVTYPHDKTLHDAALWEGPVLSPKGAAPAFYHDWKGSTFDAARTLSGWPELHRTLRVRTAIDEDELRAKSSALFAYEMIEPDGHHWIGDVGLEGIPSQERTLVVTELLAALHHGLPGIGRSQALACASKVAALEPKTWQPAGDGLAILTLQTPALLRSPHGTYGEAFQELGNGCVALVRHFASERLSGAEFMAKRFFKGRPYRPWLLTEPGSVFVLKIGTGGETFLKEGTSQGLGLPKSVRDFYELGSEPEAHLWQRCPYIPQNGYGEFSLDLPYHRSTSAGEA